MTRILTVLLIGLALLAGGCNDDEISSLPEANGTPPLYINTFAGGSIQMTGSWGGCGNDGTSSWSTTITFIGGQADVIDRTFTSNINCILPADFTDIKKVVFRNEGSVMVNWDSPGSPVGGPIAISATRVFVSFPDGSVAKGVSVVNPAPAPPPLALWYATWDDHGYPLDGAGYPTMISPLTIWARFP